MKQKAKIMLSIFQIYSAKEKISKLVGQSLNSTNMLSTYEKVVPYKIGMNTKKYVDKIIEKITQQDNESIEIMAILIGWFDEFHKEMSKNGTKTLAQLAMDYSDEQVWLYSILEGKVEAYHRMHNSALVTIEQKVLQETFEANQKLIEQAEHLRKGAQTELFNQEQIEKLKELEQEQAFLTFIKKKHPEYAARQQLYGKRIAFFVEKIVHDEQIQDMIQEYGLKDFQIYSSVDIPNRVGNFDYILFSTTRASHSALYKLRTITNTDITPTVSVNIQAAMEDLKCVLISQMRLSTKINTSNRRGCVGR